MILVNYFIKTLLISGVLFGYYHLFLKNRQFHVYNRFFLLAGTLLSLILPFLKFKIPGFLSSQEDATPIRLLGVGRGTLDETMSDAQNDLSQNIHWEFILYTLTGVVIVILIIRFIKSLIYIQKLRGNNPVEYLSDARIYYTHEKGTPFSYFRNIFWDSKIDLHSKNGAQILLHELFHVRSKHSLDILFLEITCILNWFNPFYHLIRRELKAIHEYSADAYASDSFDVFDYARLLILNASVSTRSITHPFFNNLIKRRITMITKNKSVPSSLSARLLVLPLAVLLICLFGFQTQKLIRRLPQLAAGSIRAVVDAGHGGAYDGTTFQNVQEKDINLSIAKKIQELAKNYNIEIVLSRDKDETPGSTELRKSLEYIASLPGKNQANLFVSIHTNRLSDEGNSFQTEHSGFEIYVSRRNNDIYNNSVKLASSITESIKPDYIIAPEIKQRDKGVYILDKATVPAVLIECGYMDNATDLKYLQDEKKQEKIAEDILEGIKKYSDQSALLPAMNNRNSEDTVIDKILTYDEMKKINPDSIKSIDVNKGKKQIFIEFKNGKNAIVFLKDDDQKKTLPDTLILHN